MKHRREYHVVTAASDGYIYADGSRIASYDRATETMKVEFLDEKGKVIYVKEGVIKIEDTTTEQV